MNLEALSLDIASIHKAYQQGLRPRELISFLHQRADAYADRNIWIKRLSLQEIEPYLSALEDKSLHDFPIYGVPFAIKDNIDLQAVETTAACQDFAYQPDQNAFIVDRLIRAGAIPMGKTNMDQFATGLVGTRSPQPWGPCKNAFDPEYISGGSSSGSAVSVSLGLVSFSLGTDTAGSGRVPAMLNNLVGLKPTKGLLSMSGVVPACRSLDCPSIFALTVSDAEQVFSAAVAHDPSDAYSRENPFCNSHRAFGVANKAPKIGIPVPQQLNFFGEPESQVLFDSAISLWKTLGADIHEVDFDPLLSAARMLYEGPWVAERYVAMQALMETQPENIHPVVRGIVEAAEGRTAIEAFKSEYQMQTYRAAANKIFQEFDFLLTPTAPRHYKIDELLAEPVKLNSNMGFYTNYMNLLDLCGLAVPSGFMANGMPFGVTMIAPAFNDQKLVQYALIWETEANLPLGASGQKSNASVAASNAQTECASRIKVAVCGAHLSGLPLNWQLRERGGQLETTAKTSATYRMYLLDQVPPKRPGLIRDLVEGSQIDLEIWSLPSAEMGGFVANIPHPLGIGKVELADGTWVSGFICEPAATQDALEITDMGSWRNYLAEVN